MNHQQQTGQDQIIIMQPQSEPLPEPRRLQIIHGKEADEADAAVVGGVVLAEPSEPSVAATTTATIATTTTAAPPPEPEPEPEPEQVVVEELIVEEDPHQQVVHQTPIEDVQNHENIPEEPKPEPEPVLEVPTKEQIKKEYEAQFPPVPETPGAATTFALFSDPNRFSAEALTEKTHYLSDALEGTLWLDLDANGIRGSDSNSSLNAKEYDTGIGGVKLSLVECSTNLLAQSTSSLPNNGGGAFTSLRTEVPEAGKYSFPTDIIDKGRYYVMYQAPPNYRISGNILPLEREGTDEYFECIPKGGEGDEYQKEVEAQGDLDWGGYCARSIGCLEVDKAFELLDEFPNHEFVVNGMNGEDFQGTDKTLVALPSASFLNVGLAEEPWPLSTVQYADAQISLSFPSSVSKDLLAGAVPEDFEGSEVKKSLETALGRMLNEGGASGAFAVQGVVLHGAHIKEGSTLEGEATEDANSGGESGLRKLMLRGLQGEVEVATPNEPLATPNSPRNNGDNSQVTYTFTTRGRYNPPPFEQLGSIISDSINSDPQGLVKSLKDRENIKLPPVFEEVESANARHLSLKVEKPKNKQPGPMSQILEFEEAGSQKIASWATVPIILLAFLIAALTGVLLWRRVFTRRVKVDKRRHVELYLKGGSGFAVNNYHLEDKKSKDPEGFTFETVEDTSPTISTEPGNSSTSDGEESPPRSHSRRAEDRNERRRRRTRDTALTTSGLTTQSASTAQSVASRSISTAGSRASRGSSHASGSHASGEREQGHVSRSSSRNHRTRGHRSSSRNVQGESMRSTAGQTIVSAPGGVESRRRKAKSSRGVDRAQSMREGAARKNVGREGRMVHSLRNEY